MISAEPQWEKASSHHLLWCHMKIQPVVNDCQQCVTSWVGWLTRCVHLCKPAITRIIGLATCTAHRGLLYPLRSVSGALVYVHIYVCSLCSCGLRRVMTKVCIYCSLQYLNHSLSQSIVQINPSPRAAVRHTLSHPWHYTPPPPISCFMAPRLHSSSEGDRIKLSCDMTALCLLMHVDWRLIMLGVWYGFWKW